MKASVRRDTEVARAALRGKEGANFCRPKNVAIDSYLRA